MLAAVLPLHFGSGYDQPFALFEYDEDVHIFFPQAHYEWESKIKNQLWRFYSHVEFVFQEL